MMTRGNWVALSLFAVAISLPLRSAEAQLAPTGGHYAGRPSDTGHAGMVNSSGGYQTSIPIELPAARGGLPVPAQISYREHGFGAAGLGWDVSLSYIRRDVTLAHRRPMGNAETAPQAREQLSLVLQGRAIDLVPTAAGWVPRRDAPELEVRAGAAGTMVMYDGSGRTYTFNSAGPPDSGGAIANGHLYLLRDVSGPGGNVHIEYNMSTVAVAGSSGLSLDLASVSYNSDAVTAGCYKNAIVFHYSPPNPAPLAVAMIGEQLLPRVDLLQSVDVQAKDSCSGSGVVLRHYQLTYAPDADTQQLRLSSVTMLGRAGTPEDSSSVPISSYAYGHLTTGPILDRTISYTPSASISLMDAHPLGITELDSSPHPSSGFGYSSRRSFIDVTGDGRPDRVTGETMALNRPAGPDGSSQLGNAAGADDREFGIAPFETRTTHDLRYGEHSNIDDEMTWRQAIDVNGDGRVDIVDAAEQPGAWAVYLNTPDPTSPYNIVWERRAYSTAPLAQHLRDRSLWTGDDFLPLSLRSTVKDRVFSACAVWNGSQWVEFEDDDGSSTGCPVGGKLLGTGVERTFTQWELKDVNGDGYPDVLFNSDPVFLDSVLADLPPPEHPTKKPAKTTRTVTGALFGGSFNAIRAAFNILGVHLTGDNDSPFSSPVTLRNNAAYGIARWVGADAEHQELASSVVDVNGDGIVDLVDGTSVFLGTGSLVDGAFFTSDALLTLPGPVAIHENTQTSSCEPPTSADTTFTVKQLAGLRDVTGDGIPDYVQRGATSFSWKVFIGTGVGFVSTAISLANFRELSSEVENCGGTTSQTQTGTYDLDGDGKPDVVSSDSKLTGSPDVIAVWRVVGSTGSAGGPEAGRLTEISNGYGAKTTITYRSAKEDGAKQHQVPFPEIVVTSVQTSGARGQGGDLAATRYAYGGAELVFDPALDMFAFHGYRRTVELLVPSTETQGLATITDSYGPLTTTDPFGIIPSETAPTDIQRYQTYLRMGRPSDVTLLSGDLGIDPWELLLTNVTADNRVISGTHYDWDARLLTSVSDPPSAELCLEMVFPYDMALSFLFEIFNGTVNNFCRAHGFAFEQSVQSWRGQPGASLGTSAHVTTRSEVHQIDDFGRALSVAQRNDLYRDDDDVCVDTEYAAPTGSNQRVLSAAASRKISNCAGTTYARGVWEYDGLQVGSVSAGFPTAYTAERRDENGEFLGIVREFDAMYDDVGNLMSLTRTRDDGAVRATQVNYDAFALAPTRITTIATGVPTMQTTIARDPITLRALSTTDPNKIRRAVSYDGFERPLLSTVTSPFGASGALSITSYLGFDGSDPKGRRVVRKTFTDPVDPGSASAAAGRTSTVYLDELGRQRGTELALGADYANQFLIAGARAYDSLGRINFEADPFPASAAFPATQELANTYIAKAYGTTRFFNPDGTPSCIVRGNGHQQVIPAVSEEASEVFPTCFQRVFQDHTEVVNVRDPASLLPGSPQFGVTKSSYATAVGHLVARSTWQGAARLEHATFSHDRLGRQTSMTRYQDAAAGQNAVTSSWHYDSLGQLLEIDEPDAAPQLNTYDSWGELVEVARSMDPELPDGATGSGSGPGKKDPPTSGGASPDSTVRLIRRYDAIGRLIHSEQQNNQITDPETVNEYLYDQLDSTLLARPTFGLGRLTQAISPTSAVALTYDGLGRVDTRTFSDDQGGMYIEKHVLHADGTPASLELFLPDTGFASEYTAYSNDSAGRVRSVEYSLGKSQQPLFDAQSVDTFGRIQKAHYGATSYSASYADLGRRLLTQVAIASPFGARAINYDGYDPIGRERSRHEVKDGAVSATSFVYDALGQLSSATRSSDATTTFDQQITYDALGNILTRTDTAGGSAASGTSLSYEETDRDRVCHIAYDSGDDTTCNVKYDAVGNIIRQATRSGMRELTFFADGMVRTVAEGGTLAQFHYDALGDVHELNVTSETSSDARHDRRYGELIEWRDEKVGVVTTPVLTRKVPGPGGFLATRRGAGGPWVFAFGEARGNRFFTDDTGAFVQEVDYQPYGEPSSTGAQPGSDRYSSEQWNGGDALSALGLSHLGARLYDPVIGRFLSRDPLLTTRTATTTNPYAFAMNDPINGSDPTGLDCYGPECRGGPGSGPCVGCNLGDGRGNNLTRAVGGFLNSAWNYFFGDDYAPPPGDAARATGLAQASSSSVEEKSPSWQFILKLADAGNCVGCDIGYPDPMYNIAAVSPTLATGMIGPAALSGAAFIAPIGGAAIVGGLSAEAAVTVGIGGTVLASHPEVVEEAEAGAAELMAFRDLAPRLADPGLAQFVNRLENAGVKVLNTNISIVGADGNALGEIDVVTENALIQFKNGASSANAVLGQVLERTEPYVSRPVVTFINALGKAATRTVTGAGGKILITNDFQLLLDVIK